MNPISLPFAFQPNKKANPTTNVSPHRDGMPQYITGHRQYRSDSVGAARVLSKRHTLKRNPRMINHFSPPNLRGSVTKKKTPSGDHTP